MNPGDFVPILGKMGVRVLEAQRGRAVAELPPEPNVNHFGVAYAGSLFSLAECLGGVLALTTFDVSSGLVPIVKDVHIEFHRPAMGTIRAEAGLSDEEITRVAAEAESSGRSEFTLTARLSDAEGTVVASTRGTYQLRRLPKTT